MKTRVISLLLALVMIITAAPAMSVFAFAEDLGAEDETTYYDLSSLESFKEDDLAKEGVDAESVARVYALTTKTYDRLSAAQRHSVIADVIASIDAESGLRSFIGTDDEATTDVYEDAVAAQLYFDKLAVSKMVIDGSLYEQDGLQFHASFFNAADGDAISASTNWKSFLVNSKDGMSTNFSVAAPDKPRLDENGYMVTGNYTKSNGTVVENVIITDPAYEMLQFNSGSLKSLWYGTIVYNPETGEYYKYSDGTTPSKSAPTDSYNASGADSTTCSGANITFGSSLSSKTDYSYQFVMAYDATAPALSDSSNRIVTQSLQTVNFHVDTGLSKLAGAFKTIVSPAKGTSYDWSFAYYDTSATGNTPIYHGDVFDLTFVDDIISLRTPTDDDASAGVHTLRVYTGTHLLGQNENYPLADKTSAGQTFKSSYTDIFAIRVYAKALTVEDITQNHFADLVNYYQLDISGYNTLSENGKDAVKAELQSISVADKVYTTHDAVQARLDELVIDNFDYDGLRENGTGYAFNHTIDLAKHYKLSVTEYISLDAGARAMVDYSLLTVTTETYASEAAAQSAFDALVDKYSLLDYSACNECIEGLVSYMCHDLSSASTQDEVDNIGVVYSLKTEIYDRLSPAQRDAVIADVVANIATFRAYIGTATADVDSQLYFDNLCSSKMVDYPELYVSNGLTYRLDFFAAVENSTDALTLAGGKNTTSPTKYQKYGTNTILSTAAGRFVYKNGHILTTYNNTFAYPEATGTDVNKTVQVISGIDMTTSTIGTPQVYQLDEIRVSVSRSTSSFTFSAMAKPKEIDTKLLGGYSDTMYGNVSPTGNTAWNATPDLTFTKNDKGYLNISPFEFTLTADNLPAKDMASQGYTSSLHEYAYIDSTAALTSDNSAIKGFKIKDSSTESGFKVATTSNDKVVVDLVYNGVANVAMFVDGKEIYNQPYYYKNEVANAKQFSTTCVMDIYAIRVYDRALSADEIAQNHLADLAVYYQLDVSNYVLLSDDNKKIVDKGMQAIALVGGDYKTHDEIQSYFDGLVFEYFDYDALREIRDGEAYNHFIDLAKYYKLSVTPYFELGDMAQDGIDDELLAVTTSTYEDRAEAQAALDALVEYYDLDYSGVDRLDSSFYEIYIKAIRNIKSTYEPTNTKEKAQDYLNTIVDIFSLDFSTYYKLKYETRKAIYAHMLSSFDFTDYIDSATPNADAQAWLDAYISSVVNDYNSLYVKNENLVYNLNFFGAEKTGVQTDETALKELLVEKYLKTGKFISFVKPTFVLDKDEDGYAKATLNSSGVPVLKTKTPTTFADYDIYFEDNCFILGAFELEGQFKLYDAEGNLVTDNEKYPGGIGNYTKDTKLLNNKGAESTIAGSAGSMHSVIYIDKPSYTSDHTYQIVASYGVEDTKTNFPNQIFQLPTFRTILSASTDYVSSSVMHYGFDSTTGTWKWMYTPIVTSSVKNGVPFTYTSIVDVVSTAINEDDKHIIAGSTASYIGKAIFDIYMNDELMFGSDSYAVNQPLFSDGYWYLNNYSIGSTIGTGGGAPIYAIRIYDTALTPEDIKLNRFADIASFYALDLVLYSSISEEQQEQVREELFSSLTDGDFSYNSVEVQELLDAKCSEYITDAYDKLYVQEGLKYHISFFGANDSEDITSTTDWSRFFVNTQEGMSTTFSVTPAYKPVLDENGFVTTVVKNNKTVLAVERDWNSVKFVNGALKSVWNGTIAVNPETKQLYKYADGTTVAVNAPTASFGEAGANVPTNNGVSLSFFTPQNTLDHTYQFVMSADTESAYDNTSRRVEQMLQAPVFRMSAGLNSRNTDGSFSANLWLRKYTNSSYSWETTSFAETGVTNATAIKNQQAFDFTIVADITSTRAATSDDPSLGTFNATLYTNDEQLAKYENNNIYSSGSMSSTMKSSWTDIYAIRVYEKVLTASEMEQNHFADILKYYQVNIDSLNMLPESFRDELYGIFNDYRVGDNEVEASELQKIFDDAVQKVVEENEQFFEASKIINFEGYQVRKINYNGLRSLYSVNSKTLAELENDGFIVEFGTVMAVSIDGRSYEDLCVAKDANGKTVAYGQSIMVQEIYNSEQGYVGNIYDNNGNVSFAVTITYEKSSSQTKEMYELPLMYRAYIAITDKETGEITYVYVDNESPKFGDEISMYEIADHFVNEAKEYYMIVQDVIKTVDNSLPETTYTLNGQNVAKYTIIIDDTKYRQAAEHLQNALYELTEYKLTIADAPVYPGLALKLGCKDTENVWQYNFEVDGAEIDLYGCSTSGVMYACDEFLNQLRASNSVTLTSQEYNVKDLFVEGKTYAMEEFFGEDGRFVDGGVENPTVVYASLNEIPEDVAASDPIVMVFLGASNSEGGPNYFKLFAEAIASTLKKNVVYYNAGVGGTTSNITAMRFYHSAGQYEPDIIVLDENSNDTGSGQLFHQNYTESILYQTQQLSKIPVVIFNQIPRPNDSSDSVVANAAAMIANKTAVTSYYGIANIDIYSSLQERYNAVNLDLAANGTSSEHYSTYSTIFNKGTGIYKTYLATLQDEHKINFLGYLAQYYNTTEVTNASVSYNVHPKGDGYTLFGQIMSEKLLADPYRYLTNRVMTEDYTLFAPTNEEAITVEYTLIGADGTVLSYDAEAGETREITYSDGGWNIYTEDNPYTPDGDAKTNTNYDYEKITMSSGLIYKTPYFADGIAQTYNVSGASFSFKTTADEIAFYFPISGVGNAVNISVVDEAGNAVDTATKSWTCKQVYVQAYGRLSSIFVLPGDGQEYTVTFTVSEPSKTNNTYLFRFGYIIERNYKD